MCCSCFARALSVLCWCFASALLVLCECFAIALLVLFCYSAGALLVLGLCFASALLELCDRSIPMLVVNDVNKDFKVKETKLRDIQFLTYPIPHLCVFEVLTASGGDAFSKCVQDLFPARILRVIFGARFMF